MHLFNRFFHYSIDLDRFYYQPPCDFNPIKTFIEPLQDFFLEYSKHLLIFFKYPYLPLLLSSYGDYSDLGG